MSDIAVIAIAIVIGATVCACCYMVLSYRLQIHQRIRVDALMERERDRQCGGPSLK